LSGRSTSANNKNDRSLASELPPAGHRSIIPFRCTSHERKQYREGSELRIDDFDPEKYRGILGLLQIATHDVPHIIQKGLVGRTIPDAHFYKWLCAPRQWILKYVAAVLIAFSILHLTWLALGGNTGAIALCGAGIGHLACAAVSSDAIPFFEIVLLLPIAVYISTKPDRDPHPARIAPTIEQAFLAENRFFEKWPYLWFSWFALYLLLAIKTLNGEPKADTHLIPPDLLTALIHLANNLSTLVFFSLFVDLTEKKDGRTAGRADLPFLIFLLLLFAAEWITTSRAVADLGLLWSLSSGVIGGVFTTLVVARLTSKIFDLPLFTVVFLTLYAVIQPLGSYVTDPKTKVEYLVGSSLIMFALYGKLILLCAVEWKRDGDRMAWYMLRSRRILEEEDEKRLFNEFKKTVKQLTTRERERDQTGADGPKSSGSKVVPISDEIPGSDAKARDELSHG
jgi:hypothetical protein